MICTLTARRLKPGSSAEFLAAFEARGQAMPDAARTSWNHVYVCRDVNDEDVVLSFGFFDGGLDELRAVQSNSDAFEPYVDEVLLDGAYDVFVDVVPS